MQRVEETDNGVGGVRGRRGAESQELHMWLLQSNGRNNHLLFDINRAINMETVSILEKYDLIRQCL